MSVFGGDDDLTIHARIDNDASPKRHDIRDKRRGVEVQADRTGRTASKSSRGFSVMGRAAKVAAFGAKLAFGAALAGGYALVKLLQASFGEAREAQKVGATTAAIIKATGSAAKVSERHVAKLAERLSVMAGIDDELIQTGANLLLTFKNVRNEAGKGNKVFDRATKAAVDLSAAGFGSVESGSKMLGKALNDPLKGITALSRAGVTFTQVQQDTIKKLVEQGDLLKAQKIILGEVEAQVGGVAKAQATWGDKARVTFDNIQERLGTALLPLLDDLGEWFVRTGGPALDRYVGIFERRGVPAIRNFVDDVKPLAREYLPELWDILKNVYGTVGDIAPVVGDLLKGFNDLPAPIKSALLIAAGAAKFSRKISGGGVLGATFARPLPVVVTNPGFAAGGKGGGTAVVGADGKPKGAPKGGRAGSIAKTGLAGGALFGLSFLDGADQIMADPFGELKAELLWPWLEGPFSKEKTTEADRRVKQMWADLERNTAHGARALEELLVDPMLGAKAATEKWRDTYINAMTDGRNKTQGLIGILGQLDNTSARPTVSINGVPAALSAIGTINQGLANLGFLSGGPSNASPPAPDPGHNWHQLYGDGKGKHHRDQPTTQPRPKTLTPVGGGVVINGLTVHAEGANTELDVVEAVGRALEEHFRERDERA